MNSTASAELISAASTPASVRAPTIGGRSTASSVGSARSACGRSGCSTRATMPSMAGQIANSINPTALIADADAHGACAFGAVGLLHQARRDDERRHQQRERRQRVAWRSGERRERRRHAGGVCKPAPPADHRQGEQQREREAGELDRQLDEVHPCRAEQAAGDEVDEHDAAGGDGPHPARPVEHDLQDRRRSQQLAGKDGQRHEPDEDAGRPHASSGRSATPGNRRR